MATLVIKSGSAHWWRHHYSANLFYDVIVSVHLRARTIKSSELLKVVVIKSETLHLECNDECEFEFIEK